MAHLMLLVLVAITCSGCDVAVCELNSEDNVCDDDDDCLLAYCGINCCPCPQVVSRRQFDNTYCMVRASEGFEAARQECQEARDTNCEDVSCAGMTVCPRPPDRAACVDGSCRAAYNTN